MARASVRSDHPLAGDARDTLRRLHRQATRRANRQERRLIEEPDILPRGPLPVMARAAAARTEALHLLIALAALGDRAARLRLRPALEGVAAPARSRTIPKAGGRRSSEPEPCEMSPDLLALGEAWGRFADRLCANVRRAEAAGNAEAERRPLDPKPRDSDHDLPPRFSRWPWQMSGPPSASPERVRRERSDQAAAEAIFGETRGLYPRSIDPNRRVDDPDNWDPRSHWVLTNARRAMGMISERNEIIKRVDGRRSRNQLEARQWHQAWQAARLRRSSEIPPDAAWFNIRNADLEPRPQRRHPRLGAVRFWRSYGPFVNGGGGDVRRGRNVMIDIYVPERE